MIHENTYSIAKSKIKELLNHVFPESIHVTIQIDEFRYLIVFISTEDREIIKQKSKLLEFEFQFLKIEMVN